MTTEADNNMQSPVAALFTLGLRKCNLTTVPDSPFGTQRGLLAADLSENWLTSLPPDFFLALPLLRTLKLQHNRVRSLPSEIRRLAALQELYIDHNQLRELPDAVGELKSLRTLSASWNQLAGLPDTISGLAGTLLVLNVSQNEIRSLPAGVGALANLKELYLYHNRLKAIPGWTWKLPQLETLSMEWFRYTSPPLPICLRGTLLRLFRARCAGLSDCSFSDFISRFSEVGTDAPGTEFPRKYAGFSRLHIATVEGDEGVVMELTSNENPASGGLLQPSADSLNPGVTTLLTSLRGTDPNAKTDQGNTAMHELFGSFDRDPAAAGKVAEQLIRVGADVLVLNSAGLAPLHVAVMNSQREAVRWAVERLGQGVVNIPTNDGRLMTPLHLASKINDLEIILDLLTRSPTADALLQDSKGRTPRQLGLRDRIPAIDRLLLRRERRQFRTLFERTPDESMPIITITVRRVRRAKLPLRGQESCSTASSAESGCTPERPRLCGRGCGKAFFPKEMRLPRGENGELEKRVGIVADNGRKTYERYAAWREILLRNARMAEADVESLLEGPNCVDNKGLRDYVVHSAKVLRSARRVLNVKKVTTLPATNPRVIKVSLGAGVSGYRPRKVMIARGKGCKY